MSTVDQYLEKLKAETIGKLPIIERLQYIMQDSAERIQPLLDIEAIALFENTVRPVECFPIRISEERGAFGWVKHHPLTGEISGFVFRRQEHPTYLLFLLSDTHYQQITCHKLKNSIPVFQGRHSEEVSPKEVIPYIVGPTSLDQMYGGDDLQLKIVQILFEHFTAFPSEQDDES